VVSRKEELDDLIAAFGRRVHEEHPNPDRVGCPGRPALTRFANEPEAFRSDPILDHVRQCAACLNELKELRLSIKRPQ
jgi:dihydropteroate synthase